MLSPSLYSFFNTFKALASSLPITHLELRIYRRNEFAAANIYLADAYLYKILRFTKELMMNRRGIVNVQDFMKGHDKSVDDKTQHIKQNANEIADDEINAKSDGVNASITSIVKNRSENMNESIRQSVEQAYTVISKHVEYAEAINEDPDNMDLDDAPIPTAKSLGKRPERGVSPEGTKLVRFADEPRGRSQAISGKYGRQRSLTPRRMYPALGVDMPCLD